MRILLSLLLALVGITAQAITIEVSTVGDANNAANSGHGAVDFEYALMTHEFTNAQYAEFLNSIAATDTHSLYNTAMGTDGRGGITRSGTSGKK